MTFVSATPEAPAPRRITGLIDRCGFDSGGEYGADWIFVLTEGSEVFSLNPRRCPSKREAERTLALTKPGDEVEIVVSADGRIAFLDNRSTGMTTGVRDERLRPASSRTFAIEACIVVVITFVVGLGFWSMMSDMQDWKAERAGKAETSMSTAVE